MAITNTGSKISQFLNVIMYNIYGYRFKVRHFFSVFAINTQHIFWSKFYSCCFLIPLGSYTTACIQPPLPTVSCKIQFYMYDIRRFAAVCLDFPQFVLCLSRSIQAWADFFNLKFSRFLRCNTIFIFSLFLMVLKGHTYLSKCGAECGAVLGFSLLRLRGKKIFGL